MSTPGDLLEALGREARARLGGRGRSADVRVFRGRSVDELIPQIERELGADALIVRRREGLSGGVLGFFQRAFVEIEAVPGHPRLDAYDEEDEEDLDTGFIPDPVQPRAVDPAPGMSPPPAFQAPLAPAPIAPPSAPQPPAFQPPAFQAPPSAPPAAAQPPGAYAAPPPSALPPSAFPAPAPPGPQRYESAAAMAGAGTPEPYAYSPAPSREAAGTTGPGAYVTAHLAALARYEPPTPTPTPTPAPPPPAPPPMRAEPPAPASVDFQELLAPERTRRYGNQPPQRPLPEPPPTPERRTVAPGSQGRARAGVEKGLLRYGLSEDFARELIELAVAHTLPLSPRAGLAQAVRSTLAQQIPVAPTLPLQGATVVLVGPGGSGKTTACMALLGAYRAASTLPASYAALTRAPGGGELRMLLSPQIVKPTPATSARALRALRRVRVDGLAILDTPALSPADRTGIRELASLLGEIKPERVVVALPATLGAAAAEQLLEAFVPLSANSLVLTHADETDQIGVAVEAACRNGLAPEYLLRRGRAERWRLERVDPAELAVRMLQ